jgi:hypothetical protein
MNFFDSQGNHKALHVYLINSKYMGKILMICRSPRSMTPNRHRFPLSNETRYRPRHSPAGIGHTKYRTMQRIPQKPRLLNIPPHQQAPASAHSRIARLPIKFSALRARPCLSINKNHLFLILYQSKADLDLFHLFWPILTHGRPGSSRPNSLDLIASLSDAPTGMIVGLTNLSTKPSVHFHAPRSSWLPPPRPSRRGRLGRRRDDRCCRRGSRPACRVLIVVRQSTPGPG